MKKVIIIGGGISGLTAGIYAQQAGFQTEILEKNAVLGGECTGWNRLGYHIDNCIHWLTGCNPQDGLYDIWRNVGALDEDTALYREPYFYMLEMDGKQLHFWRDADRARAEFLEIAPEDRTELEQFFESVKAAECVQPPSRKSPAHMNPFEFLKMGMGMAPMGRVMKIYGSDTVSKMAQRFKNPMVREMMRRYYHQNFMAITLLSSYGFFTSGTAAIPMGGSVGMVQRMSERYRSLGGSIRLSSPVSSLQISGKRVTAITLTDGTVETADAVIFAADPAVLYHGMLDRSYMDKNLKKMYDDHEGYSVTSSFQTAFGITDGNPTSLPSGSVMFPCESYRVGLQTSDFLAVRLYDYDPQLFPADKRVIQCNLLQDEKDYMYWQQLYTDKEAYSAEKARIAADIEKRICTAYPDLAGRLTLLSTYSPMTFTKWCGAWNGAYMSFFQQEGAKSLYARNTVPGLENLFLGSQWLQCSGGLPIAAASGKFAVQALCRMQHAT